MLLDPLVIQSHQSNSSEILTQNSFQATPQEGHQGPHHSCPTVAYRTKIQTEYGSAAEGCSTPSDGSPISHVLFTSGDQQEYVINHSHESQRATMVRKQLVFCGWDGARVGGVRSSLASFREHMNKVRKCAKQLVDGFVSCLETGESLYVENCLARSWQLKPSQAHPQVQFPIDCYPSQCTLHKLSNVFTPFVTRYLEYVLSLYASWVEGDLLCTCR